jgi:peptide deformylase
VQADEEDDVGLLEIRVFGDPVLRQAALEVRDFDDALVRLAEDMALTMRANQGVGLAANQVGVLRRLFTYDDPGDELSAPSAGAVVNPELLDASEESELVDEGCLSFPGLFYPVERQLEIVVRHRDVHGQTQETELQGFGARIWLHEMDHLNGVLFIDHLARHDRREAMRLMRERDLTPDDLPGVASSLGG